MVAPIVIEFMLACHTTTKPAELIGRQTWDSPSGKTTLEFLRNHELINDNNEATERGRFWIEQICSTPLPVCKWVPGERQEKVGPNPDLERQLELLRRAGGSSMSPWL